MPHMNGAAFRLFVMTASTMAALPGQQPLTLAAAVRYALEHSPKLAAARTETARRDALAAAARAPLLPQADLTGSATLSRFDRGYPAGAPPSLLRFDQSLFTGGADLRWLVWDFRKTQLELAAARERIEAARALEDRRRQEIVFDTARAFLEALAWQDLTAAAEARIHSLQSLLDRTQKLVDGGRAVPADALKVRTRLAQMESDLAALQAARQTALAALAAEMGYDGQQLPPLADAPALQTPQSAPAQPEEDLLRQAAEGRPELRALDHEIRSAERIAMATRRALLPRVDVRASATGTVSATPLGFGQMLARVLPTLAGAPASPGNGIADWSLGAQITFPLFDGGRRRAQIREAQSTLELARLERRQTQLRIQREVRTAAANLASASARVAALRDSVAESQRVLRDERLKFEAGRSVINFVLDAESALLMNQSLLSQARRSVLVAELALELSAGRLDAGKLPGQ